MENEVIIDGCNVAKCEHLWKDNSVIDLNFCRINFDNNYFSNGIPCCDKCNKHPNCYFKQLQRVKSENEKLKEKYLASLRDNAINTELKLINDNLQAENEKLKKVLEEVKKYIKDNDLYRGIEIGYIRCDIELLEKIDEVLNLTRQIDR